MHDDTDPMAGIITVGHGRGFVIESARAGEFFIKVAKLPRSHASRMTRSGIRLRS
jgi:hypothetical protein